MQFRLYKWLLVLILGVVSGVSFIKPKSVKPSPYPFNYPKSWPKPIYNFKENPLTQEGVFLGRELFYDAALSVDSTISCVSCHQQFAAFSTYDHNVSHGVNNGFTLRNAPALQNLAWKPHFMADGGIRHLDLQPIAPLTDKNEMGESLDNVIIKLNKSKKYPPLFKAAFGTTKITTENLNKAISQFVLTLISSNSKYDKVMLGKAQFILPEQLGYEIFNKKCVTCHPPPFFTTNQFVNIGLPLINGNTDLGRMRITQNPTDSLKFVIPSLRNVAVTAPYAHDGRFYGLISHFEHYRKDMQPIPQTDSLLKNKLYLSNFEIGQLTAFLYTLTDTSFLVNKSFAPKDYPIVPSFIHLH